MSIARDRTTSNFIRISIAAAALLISGSVYGQEEDSTYVDDRWIQQISDGSEPTSSFGGRGDIISPGRSSSRGGSDSFTDLLGLLGGSGGGGRVSASSDEMMEFCSQADQASEDCVAWQSAGVLPFADLLDFSNLTALAELGGSGGGDNFVDDRFVQQVSNNGGSGGRGSGTSGGDGGRVSLGGDGGGGASPGGRGGSPGESGESGSSGTSSSSGASGTSSLRQANADISDMESTIDDLMQRISALQGSSQD